MKIMVVLPFALWAARTRASNLWPRIGREAEVHIVALRAQLPRGQEPCLPENVASLELIEFSRMRAAARAAMAVPTGAPMRTSWAADRRARRAVGDAYERIRPDVVYVERMRAAPLLDSIPGERIVLDPTDSLPMFYEQVRGQREAPLTQRILSVIETQRLIAFERARYPSFARIVACTSRDAEWMRRSAPTARVEIVPIGVNLDAFPYRPLANGGACRVVMTGNFGYWPNREAAGWLLQQAPAIKERSGAEVVFAGANPPPRLRQAHDGDGVVVTGFVPDLAAHYHNASVAVAPLRFAAGGQSKVIEAMACGRPVVVTPECAAGFGSDGRALLVEASRQEFVDAVADLLTDRRLAAGLGELGRAYVQEFHDWDNIAARLLRLLAEVAGQSIEEGPRGSDGHEAEPPAEYAEAVSDWEEARRLVA